MLVARPAGFIDYFLCTLDSFEESREVECVIQQCIQQHLFGWVRICTGYTNQQLFSLMRRSYCIHSKNLEHPERCLLHALYIARWASNRLCPGVLLHIQRSRRCSQSLSKQTPVQDLQSFQDAFEEFRTLQRSLCPRLLGTEAAAACVQGDEQVAPMRRDPDVGQEHLGGTRW